MTVTGAPPLYLAWSNRLLPFAFVFIVLTSCFGQTREVVCDDGYGTFETRFVSGVSVTVGAAKSGGLSIRSCSGTLDWDGGDLPVSTEMSQVDVDVLGADLGLGTPVVAFQVKKSAADWDMT